MRSLIETVKSLKCEEYGPPEAVPSTHKMMVFLAGTIEQNKSVDWQTKLVGEMRDYEVCLLNPRRVKWDDTWKQDITNPNFKEQVDWELDYQDQADFIVMYFDPSSKSPITLLELGLAAAQYPEKLIVACPEGYWRRGNVQIVCERFNIVLVDSLEEMITCLKEELK